MALKRAVDTEWETSAPKTTADAESGMPQLNSDCIRLLLELALGQRTLATYGADGRVVESRDYYGSPYWPATHFWHGSIHTFRRVCRQWNKIASSLVRVINIREEMSPENIMYLATLFPNASTIDWSRNSSFRPRAPFHHVFDSRRRLIVPNCPSCTFSIFNYPRVDQYTRCILARNNTIVQYMHVEYGGVYNLTSGFRAYRFPSWEEFCDILVKLVPTDSALDPISVYLQKADAVQYDTWVVVERIRTLLAKTPPAVLQHIQLHLIVDSCDGGAFLEFAQKFFPRKFVIHTTFKPSRRSGSPFHKRSSFAPNVFFDGYMYRALWASQGLLEPLV